MAIKAPILQAGDTIGIVTLGSPLNAGVINERIQFLESLGFNVALGQNVYAQTGFLAGTDEQRADDLMRMFANDAVKLILPTRGGVGVEGILPYLDYPFIESHPKIVSGYSDITLLLNALAQMSNLITLHSLMLIDFRPTTPAYNFDQFFAATSVYSPTRIIVNPPGIPQISVVQGNVTGPIVGGNLTALISTLGTPYEINTTGKILLLEETHEPINTVYRYVNMLKLAGKFDDCIGIVMGECTNCPIAYNTSYDDLINGVIVPLGKPLMTNVATGHGFYKAAIPIGATANLDTVNNSFTITEPTISLPTPL
ncbi:S66 peptidase family protein [Pseudogracilibacillus auburnensis]|uniref:S66 peptidase family protein n=1 Tax=Pseudogracilibacillus auburnensis TaxID=1494959 RepID=UPI001A978D43|nr:LD-carboxypeptidase [Pseudogracilibacillus auburnensis]MBO1004188.1 LD-carboxypeptidase [Pseudogracilibacillus auburnensis]